MPGDSHQSDSHSITNTWVDSRVISHVGNWDLSLIRTRQDDVRLCDFICNFKWKQVVHIQLYVPGHYFVCLWLMNRWIWNYASRFESEISNFTEVTRSEIPLFLLIASSSCFRSFLLLQFLFYARARLSSVWIDSQWQFLWGTGKFESGRFVSHSSSGLGMVMLRTLLPLQPVICYGTPPRWNVWDENCARASCAMTK